MSNNHRIDKHYEYFARLYLRLKGYVSSNLIIHSEVPGNDKTELDILAIRMPHHSQEYRQVNVEDYLESSDSKIEIIIADVKNTTNLRKVVFNDKLRNYNSSIEQLIDWLGIYTTTQPEHIEKFKNYLNLHKKNDWNGFAEFDENLNIGKFNIKFTFFCPSLPKWNGNGFKYIDGQEIFDFIWECLNETKTIPECSRSYDFLKWNELKEYVKFFKKKKKNKPTKEEFEKYFSNIPV